MWHTLAKPGELPQHWSLSKVCELSVVRKEKTHWTILFLPTTVEYLLSKFRATNAFC